MKHAMIDLETLGVGMGAPLFEIGLSFFDFENEVDGSRLICVDIMDVMWTTGFCPQPDTLKWWRSQEYDPTANDRVSLSEALSETNRIFEEFKPDFVWANSPSFDCIILEQHYNALGMQKPWTYRQELDFRTIRWLAKQKGWTDTTNRVVTHNGEEDANQQADLLKEMIKYV